VAPDVIIATDPFGNAASQGQAVFKRLQIKEQILDGPPSPLNENIVLAAAATIHADLNLVFFEKYDKILAGKMTALIGIENVRPSKPTKGLLPRLDTNVRLHGIGYLLRQDFTAVPVHDNNKVHETATDGN
jgi:hypothetical protein